jgi:plasmid maintenance system antidote protein VapI
MTRFGEHLKKLIDEGNVNIYALTKSTGLERTAIHKIISNGRIVAEQYVLKLADALQLSPQERQRFLESYRISKIGEFKYNQRQQVKKLIERIADIENTSWVMPDAAIANNPLPYESNTVITGRFAVHNLIKSLIEETLTCDNPAIDFVIPESNQYFYDELLNYYLRCPQLKVRHIIGFTKKADFLTSENKNLRLLSQILPFVYVPGASYQPHYFYQQNGEPELTQAMPYFILTSTKRLVLFNKDFEKAVFISDTDFVSLYINNFESMLKASKPLIMHMIPSMEVLFNVFQANTTGQLSAFYWIGPDVALKPLLTEEVIQKYMRKDIPNGENLVELTQSHYKLMSANLNRNIYVGTTDGAISAVKAGRIMGGNADIANSIAPEDVKDMLKTLKILLAESKVKSFFANPSKITIPQRTHFAINELSGISFIVTSTDNNAFQLVCFQEESITEAFIDFVESIGDSDLVYSAEETLAALDSIIEGIGA